MRANRTLAHRDALWQVPPEVGELRVGMLGAGKMAHRHLRMLRDIPGVKLVGICSRGGSAERLASEFGIGAAHHDARAMLEATCPDAVFVAVSHDATVAVSTLVLEHGIPCMLEKPAGYSVEETAGLAVLADASGTVNVVGVNRRFYGVIMEALLRVMEFGPVRGVLVEGHEPMLAYRSRRKFDAWLYDHWLLANTIHAIDLLRLVGGNVASVHAIVRNDETSNHCFAAAMTFDTAAVGSFISIWNSGGGFGLKIYGHGVVAALSPLEEGFVQYETGRRIKLRPDWRDAVYKPGLYAQNVAFLQAVCDGVPASFPASDLRDHLETVKLVTRIGQYAAHNSADQPLSSATLMGD